MVETANGVPLYPGQRVLFTIREAPCLGFVHTPGDGALICMDGHPDKPFKYAAQRLFAVNIIQNTPKKVYPLRNYLPFQTTMGVEFFSSKTSTVNGFGTGFLYGMWHYLNEAVFGGVLSLPVLTLSQSKLKLGLAMSPKHPDVKVPGKTEIKIAASHASVRSIFETLGHEMVHQHQFEVDMPNGVSITKEFAHGKTFFAWAPALEAVGIKLDVEGQHETAIDLVEEMEVKSCERYFIIVKYEGVRKRLFAAYSELRQDRVEKYADSFDDSPGAKICVYESTAANLKNYVQKLATNRKVLSLVQIRRNILLAINDLADPLPGYRPLFLRDLDVDESGVETIEIPAFKKDSL